jgi:hypothetical protein
MNAPDPLPNPATTGPRLHPAPLPERLGRPSAHAVAPTPLPAVHWVGRSDAMASELGLGD